MTDTAALVEVAARAICGVNEPDPDADMLPGTPCWVALIPEAQAVIDALHVREMREALEFYANERNWRSVTVYMCGHGEVNCNAMGDKGRKALALLNPQQEASDGH